MDKRNKITATLGIVRQPENNHTDKMKDKVENFKWEIKSIFKMKILELGKHKIRNLVDGLSGR